MNHFPSFDPNKQAKVQLGAVKLNAISLGQKSNQIQPGIGYRVTQTSGGTTVSPIKKRSASFSTPLPFSIRVTSTSLIGSPGTIEGASIAETVESSPADGTWYFVAKVIIDNSTGAITATEADWLTSNPSDTATEFYSVLATVDVVSGVPDSSTITQFNYGPIFVIFYGAVSNVWKAFIL